MILLLYVILIVIIFLTLKSFLNISKSEHFNVPKSINDLIKGLSSKDHDAASSINPVITEKSTETYKTTQSISTATTIQSPPFKKAETPGAIRTKPIVSIPTTIAIKDTISDIVTSKATITPKEKCCGLTVYENKLENIHKCINNYLEPSYNEYTDKYEFNRWKKFDYANCKSPPYVLANLSNCAGKKSIVNNYYKNFKTLEETINKLEASPEYNGYLLHDQSISDTFSPPLKARLKYFNYLRDCPVDERKKKKINGYFFKTCQQ